MLNEDQKLAVLLNKFEEMSYAEIADVMGRSPAAVKSLLARARNQLREQLEPYLLTGQRGTRSRECRDQSDRAVEQSVSFAHERIFLHFGALANYCSYLVTGDRRLACRLEGSIRCLGIPLVVPVCGAEGQGARSATHAGGDFWNSQQTRRRHVRDVPCRLVHLRICAGLCRVPGPFTGLRRGARAGTIRRGDSDLCLRLKHEQNAWLAPWLS